MISTTMTAATVAMIASQKIGQGDLGGLGRGGNSVGICHYSRAQPLTEVLRCVCREVASRADHGSGCLIRRIRHRVVHQERGSFLPP
jgi:hypothetical protein